MPARANVVAFTLASSKVPSLPESTWAAEWVHRGNEWSLRHREGWLGLGHLPGQLSSTLRQRQEGCSCFGWVTAVPRGTSISEAVDTELAEPLAQSG